LQLAALALNVVAWASPQAERPKPPEPKAARSLSDEEKQILKNRELLENLDLLRDFEKIRFLEFFRQEKPAAKPQTPAGEPSGKDHDREKNRKS
jgi:hypothetical protein